MQGAARKWGEKVGQQIVNEARARCPSDEGTLRASIDYKVTVNSTNMRLHVGSPLPYAKWVHEGTGLYGPHKTPIVPTRTRSASGGPPYLKFQWDGGGVNTQSKDKRGWVFARSVRGSKPQPFLADALEAVMGSQITKKKEQ